MRPFTTTPAAAKAGLDMFAAAWLERFTAHGGQVLVKADGSAQLFQVCDPEEAPGYEPLKLPDDWTDEQKRSRHEIDRWMFLGRQRELDELLSLVPGGVEAVKAHAKAFATHAYSDGSRGFV